VNIDPKILAIIVVGIVVIVAIAIWLVTRRKAALRERFGPEYDRAVRERGSERAAQATLAEREKRVEKFHIRELDPAERERFDERWHSVQSRFVDDPKGAVIEADDKGKGWATRRFLAVGIFKISQLQPFQDFVHKKNQMILPQYILGIGRQ
jgi:hypothetical protein